MRPYVDGYGHGVVSVLICPKCGFRKLNRQVPEKQESMEDVAREALAIQEDIEARKKNLADITGKLIGMVDEKVPGVFGTSEWYNLARLIVTLYDLRTEKPVEATVQLEKPIGHEPTRPVKYGK